MAKPDWFPLPIYSKDITIREWVDLLAMRLAVAAKVQNGRDQYSTDQLIETFMALIVRGETNKNSSLVRQEFPKPSILPVQEASLLEILYANDVVRSVAKQDKELAALIEALPDGESGYHWMRADEAQKLTGRSMGSLPDPKAWKHWPDVVGGPFALVTVDLDMSDETLVTAFEIWLAGVRQASGGRYEVDLDEKALSKWKTFQVLAAMDLRLWHDLTNRPITDTAMAQLLWDETDGVDPTERYRKTVKPMVTAMFTWNFWMRLVRQVEFTEAMERIGDQIKAERAVAGVEVSSKRSGRRKR